VSGYYMKFPNMWRKVLRDRRGQGETVTVADLIVALELLSQAKFSIFVKMTNQRAAKWGLSPHAKLRALNRLAHWGLISIDRRTNRSWIIRVRYLAGRQPREMLGPNERRAAKVIPGTTLVRDMEG
jgi:hypothetical protein